MVVTNRSSGRNSAHGTSSAWRHVASTFPARQSHSRAPPSRHPVSSRSPARLNRALNVQSGWGSGATGSFPPVSDRNRATLFWLVTTRAFPSGRGVASYTAPLNCPGTGVHVPAWGSHTDTDTEADGPKTMSWRPSGVYSSRPLIEYWLAAKVTPFWTIVRFTRGPSGSSTRTCPDAHKTA